MKRIRWGRALIATILILVAIFFTVNMVDSDLDPAITELWSKYSGEPGKNGNAFYAMGLLSESYTHKGTPMCDPLKSNNCFVNYQERKEDIQVLVESNQESLRKFSDIRSSQYSYYQEPFRLDGQKWYKGRYQIHTLFLSDIGLRWLENKEIDVFSEIEKDILFWRMILKGKTSLIGTVIAWRAIDRDIAFLQQYQGRCGNCIAGNAKESSSLKPFSREEVSFVDAMENEALYMDSVLRDVSKEDVLTEASFYSGIVDMLYTRNKTRNLMFEYYSFMFTQAARPIEEYEDAIAAAKQENERIQERVYSLSALYNPVGKILVAVATPNFERYFKMAVDTDKRRIRLLNSIQ